MDTPKIAIFALFVNFLQLLLLLHNFSRITRNSEQKIFYRPSHIISTIHDFRDSVMACKMPSCYCRTVVTVGYGNWTPGNCGHCNTSTHLKINSGCHAIENPSEETISESSQIRELHETINI